MRIRLTSAWERVRTSLFLVPMVAVVAAIVLGQLGILLDGHLDQGATTLPLGLTSTVESARTVLSTIAAATITFAGIAFSVSLLVIQLGSSQFSPRVVHTLFRDPFNRRVMALVVGTFTFCLVILRAVRSAVEEGGEPVVPNLSVSVAVVLGVAAILATVAFINHSAHSMDISEVLERVARESIRHIREEWSPDHPPPAGRGGGSGDGEGDGLRGPLHRVRFDRSGWVQQIDTEALAGCVPAGSVVEVHTFPGRYAIPGTTMCTISPPPEDAAGVEARVRAAFGIGVTRTMQQDVAYGLRQLVDVALKALSPGINDPTTAQDAIFHAAAVLGELLVRNPPPVAEVGEGGQVRLVEEYTHEELARLAFDETRRAAAGHPTVCIYLLESIEQLCEAVGAAGFPDRVPMLVDQARLVVAGCETAGVLPDDLQAVRDAYRKRFGGG